MTYSRFRRNPFARFSWAWEPTSVSYVTVRASFPMDVYNWESGYFFQDDWKVTPRLTVNLGDPLRT